MSCIRVSSAASTFKIPSSFSYMTSSSKSESSSSPSAPSTPSAPSLMPQESNKKSNSISPCRSLPGKAHICRYPSLRKPPASKNAGYSTCPDNDDMMAQSPISWWPIILAAYWKTAIGGQTKKEHLPCIKACHPMVIRLGKTVLKIPCFFFSGKCRWWKWDVSKSKPALTIGNASGDGPKSDSVSNIDPSSLIPSSNSLTLQGSVPAKMPFVG